MRDRDTILRKGRASSFQAFLPNEVEDCHAEVHLEMPLQRGGAAADLTRDAAYGEFPIQIAGYEIAGTLTIPQADERRRRKKLMLFREHRQQGLPHQIKPLSSQIEGAQLALQGWRRLHDLLG